MAKANNSDDFDYEIWAAETKTTLVQQALWDVVENVQPEELSKWRDLVAKDAKAVQVLKSSLPDSVNKKALSASSAKQVWDLLDEEAKIRKLEKQLEETSVSEKDLSNVWFVSEFDLYHMTPYEKYFTSIEKKPKVELDSAKVAALVDCTVRRIGGGGDVKIMTKGGKKKTIKNVILIPGSERNVLSLPRLTTRGYSVTEGEGGKRIIRDRTGAELGETLLIEEEWALRLNVIEGNLTA